MKQLMTLGLLLVCTYLSAQEAPNQVIRGRIVDQQSESPLFGANIVVVGTDPIIGAVTDEDGKFRLENVPIGRQTLRITYLGYESREMPNMLVTTGKEMVLTIGLQESLTALSEVTIEGNVERGERINQMATVSARTFSVEETKRYAGSIDDPSRMASGFAGVGAVDGNNDLVIRGNSPRGMLWRMEGIEIPNPNHFSNQGSSGGPISMLSTNMMANSEFFTGAFPAEYGNAYSGIFDINLRRGNNEQREYTFGVSVLGTDIAVEGPFRKGYDGSYLVNYRYSTLSVFELVGLDIVGDVIPKYQDLSYNFALPTKKLGQFSIFGLGGMGVATEKWEWDGHHYSDEFRSNTAVTGLKHTYLIGDKTLFKTVAAVMATDRTYVQEMFDTNDVFIRDSYNEHTTDEAFRLTTTVNHKFNARHTVKIGAVYNLMGFDYESRYFDRSLSREVINLQSDGSAERYQGYAQWQWRPGTRWTVNAGLHHTLFALNDQQVLEPRLGARFQLAENQWINAGAGLHSGNHDLSVYYVELTDAAGKTYRPNEDLKMMRSMHYVLGYERMFGSNLRAKAEVYYQYLWDVPVDVAPGSKESLINSTVGFPSIDFSNKGTAENYGAELTVERYFTGNWYAMFTGSWFQSTYTPLDGKEYNTRWNGNYIHNILAGKEFQMRKPGRVLGVSGKGVWYGGHRYTPVLLAESQEAGHSIEDQSRYLGPRTPDYFRLDLQLSYRIDRPKTTHYLKLDIQNATNRVNYYDEFYNAETKAIERNTLVGILPVLGYKIQF